MTLTRTLVPVPNAPQASPVMGNIAGKLFYPSAGPVTLDSNDGAISALSASGVYTRLPLAGTTAQRPKEFWSGDLYLDTTLGEIIVAQVWPPNSGKVCGWINAAGEQV